MEVAPDHRPVLPPSLARPAPSFRLRTESLNTLRLRRIFDLFDQNGDGEITVDELSLALEKLGLGADSHELTSTLAEYIPPGNSGLAFEDFSALHRALGEALFGEPPAAATDAPGAMPSVQEDEEMEEDMREAFRVFDEDGDGFISAAELQVVLKNLGLPEGGNITKVREMIGSADLNDDGRIDYGEFKHMMSGITVWGA